mmetsp:Transcript_146132/g.354673  ORF Transcript_146132/g.354673 Transcript_146132/m.354673 type:complete len:223 (-) Transcript_146132:329-997(-)
MPCPGSSAPSSSSRGWLPWWREPLPPCGGPWCEPPPCGGPWCEPLPPPCGGPWWWWLPWPWSWPLASSSMGAMSSAGSRSSSAPLFRHSVGTSKRLASCGPSSTLRKIEVRSCSVRRTGTRASEASTARESPAPFPRRVHTSHVWPSTVSWRTYCECPGSFAHPKMSTSAGGMPSACSRHRVSPRATVQWYVSPACASSSVCSSSSPWRSFMLETISARSGV